jgi:hypothetical protein
LPVTDGKTTIQVFGAYGNTSTITLGDTADTAIDIPYVFKSDARPVKLVVKGVDADGQLNTRAARFRVTVTDTTRDIAEQTVAVFNNITNSSTEVNPTFELNELRAGMQVVFEAVAESYFDAGRNFAYHTVSAGSEANPSRGVERYVASGLSVNNTPQTADPTQYSFEIRQDTEILFRTRHEYALDMKSDFSGTSSELTTAAGAHWAGPLSSAASGSPDPAVGVSEHVRHWIVADSQVVAQIDSEVQDLALSAQQLYTRYVPYKYAATGAACGDTAAQTATVVLPENQMSGSRHQLNFQMKSHGSITYMWKIQFGVYAQSPEQNLRKVSKFIQGENRWQEADPSGAVYWFDQGDTVRVLAAANKDGVDSKALGGWALGDGYYFASDGNINTDTGVATGFTITRDANDNPVAEWVSGAGEAKPYRGLEILALKRPVAVMWNYGRQVFYDPQLKLGEYMLQGRSRPIEQRYPAVAARLFDQPSRVDPPDAAVWDPNAKVLFPIKPGTIKAIYTNETADTGFEVHITAG